MNNSLLFLPLAVLVSCASVPRPTESDLTSRVQAVLDGPSHPAPLELTIDPDYVDERWTLVRTIFVRKNMTSMPELTRENEDMPIGVSFGNGLYLDDANNLSIRVDRLSGVGPDFQGTTEFWTRRPGEGPGKRAEYAEGSIAVNDPGSLFGKYQFDLSVDSTPIAGGRLVRLDEGYQFNALNGSLWTPTKRGVKKSWTEGLEILLSGPRTFALVLNDNRITDQRKAFSLEHRGEYIRVSFALGPTATFRLYRSASTTVVINEDNGGMVVFRSTADGLEWQTVAPRVPVGEFRAEGRLTRSES